MMKNHDYLSGAYTLPPHPYFIMSLKSLQPDWVNIKILLSFSEHMLVNIGMEICVLLSVKNGLDILDCSYSH